MKRPTMERACLANMFASWEAAKCLTFSVYHETHDLRLQIFLYNYCRTIQSQWQYSVGQRTQITYCWTDSWTSRGPWGRTPARSPPRPCVGTTLLLPHIRNRYFDCPRSTSLVSFPHLIQKAEALRCITIGATALGLFS